MYALAKSRLFGVVGRRTMRKNETRGRAKSDKWQKGRKLHFQDQGLIRMMFISRCRRECV
jgi:hypothetical protein